MAFETPLCFGGSSHFFVFGFGFVVVVVVVVVGTGRRPHASVVHGIHLVHSRQVRGAVEVGLHDLVEPTTACFS